MSTTPRAWIAKDGSYEGRAAPLRQTSDHDVRRRRGRRQADGDVDEIQVVQVTLTSVYFSTLPRPTPSSLSAYPSLLQTTSLTRTLASIKLSTISSSTTGPEAPASTGHITPASPPGFPTTLVASLCTLLPVAFLITLFFYLYYRHRHPTPAPSVASEDKYVWGPLGLMRRKERDKDHPVLKSEQEQTKVDPIAEAIREEERQRLGRMKRSGEARFYAPGVRHLVEYVGSKERVRVMIDWRDRVRMNSRS